jgi:hypothetical protein
MALNLKADIEKEKQRN